MDKFSVGDTVQITGQVMPGSVGTVVHIDVKRGKYLVRVDATLQNYYDESELEAWSST